MNRQKILVVDDVESNRLILAEIFRKDYQALEAADTKAALQILEKDADNIAVVLLDWHLSGEDGGKVLEAMRKKGWMDHIPTLVVTAEQSIETERKCIGLGAADMIRKPFDSGLITFPCMSIKTIWK